MASPGGFCSTQPLEGFYACQDDRWSTHFLFPKIGKESGEAFYLYLQNWGLGLPVLHDGYEHLLKLQALFWRNITDIRELDHKSSGPPNAIQAHRWKDDQDLAEHVKHVTHALEGRGSGKVYQTTGELVFVVHDDSKTNCNNLSCPGADGEAARQIKSDLTIKLEPLLDWGTVSPASDVEVASGRIFPFRRNGPRMNDPLWTQQVGKLVPKQLRTYCLDCLEELIERQAEAQLIIGRSLGQPQRAGNHYAPIQPIKRPSSRSELYDHREGSDLEEDWSVEGLASSTAGSLHLDGVADQTPHAEPRNYVSIRMDSKEASWTAGNDLLVGNEVCVKESSLSQHLSRPFTPPPGPSRFDSVHSRLSSISSSYYPFSLNNPQPPTPETSRNRAFVYRDPTCAWQEGYEKLGSGILLKDSVPHFGSSNRRFGRDIDTNAVPGFFTNHRIRRENMFKAKDAEIRNFFTAVDPTGPVTPNRAVKTKSVTYEESDFSDVASDISKEEDDSDAPGAEYTPVKAKGKAGSKSVSPKKKTPSPKKKTPSPPSKPAGKAQPSYAPVHRKRDPATDSSAPFGVAQAAFEIYLLDTPSKTDIICTCRKPALTYDVQITQCINKGCKVRWYHKDCLAKRGKLQARHGTYLCEQCQNEKYYADLSRAKGWTTKKLVQDETGMPFTGQEMAGTLGNTGNFQAVANPYGLATSTSATTLSPFAKPFIPGGMVITGAAALSRLAVGSEPSLRLETSRPYFVTEAYTRAGEHRRAADEEFERLQVYGCLPDGWDEEMGEGDEDDEDEDGCRVHDGL